MKTTKSIIATVFIMFILLQSGKTQSFWEWSPPVPLTDSISDNTNPYIYRDYYDGLLMVWEKPIDSTTTAIYMDNILDADPPEELLHSPGVQYANPKIMDIDYSNNTDSAFLLLYETNQNGNIDIYCKAYLKNGAFLESAPLVNSQDDEDQFTIGRNDLYWGDDPYARDMLAYIRNDSLFVRSLMTETGNIYFEEAVFIDGPSCMDPVGSGDWGNFGLTYLKADSGEYHIYKSSSGYDGVWSSPEVIYDTADCRNIDRALHYGNLVWSANIDTSWRIIVNDYWGGNSMYDISMDAPFDPAALGLILGVKSWFPDIWLATPYFSADTAEIYMTEYPGNPDLYNFTSSGIQNRNPQFFNGEGYSYGCWYDYLIWESYRNGHWQVWCSKVIQCAGKINENDLENSFIKTHPNPFIKQTTLAFTLEDKSNVIIDIYNNQGVHVSTIANHIFDPGTHQLRWNADGLAAGMYIIKMIVGDMTYTSKVIKNQ